MKKLNSFAEFSASKIEKAAFDLAEKQEAKRSNEAATFKTLLSEYGVGAIKELSEEQRSEFFNKIVKDLDNSCNGYRGLLDWYHERMAS